MCNKSINDRNVRHFWVTVLPKKKYVCPNSIYFLKSGDNPIEMFISSIDLELYPVTSSQSGVKVIPGVDNPNNNPPASYNIGDFYVQKDSLGNVLGLWQYNGIKWVKGGEQNPEPVVTKLQDGQELDLPYVDTNTFYLPENYILVSVFINIALNRKVRYVREGNTVRILEDLEQGDVVNFRGFVALGEFSISPPSTICMSASCIQSLPLFENETEASGLPNYTPYRTSLGAIMYKLPGEDLPLVWIDPNPWLDAATWID